MIIFYNKKSLIVFGVVEGRIHEHPENEMIKPSDVAEEDIGMYLVPFKPVFQEIEKPIKKFFLKNKKTGEVEERVVGTEKETIPAGLVPDIPFSNQILRFERKIDDIFQYKIKLDQEGNVIGFQKNV